MRDTGHKSPHTKPLHLLTLPGRRDTISLNNREIESICKALELNSDVTVLEASTSLRYSLLEKLGRDPELSIYDEQEKIRAAARTRHEAELKELEARLSWERFTYLKDKKFVDRE